MARLPALPGPNLVADAISVGLRIHSVQAAGKFASKKRCQLRYITFSTSSSFQPRSASTSAAFRSRACPVGVPAGTVVAQADYPQTLFVPLVDLVQPQDETGALHAQKEARRQVFEVDRLGPLGQVGARDSSLVRSSRASPVVGRMW